MVYVSPSKSTVLPADLWGRSMLWFQSWGGTSYKQLFRNQFIVDGQRVLVPMARFLTCCWGCVEAEAARNSEQLKRSIQCSRTEHGSHTDLAVILC